MRNDFRVLHHFNTNSAEYSLVFTANATAALKLLAECFDFGTPQQAGDSMPILFDYRNELGKDLLFGKI